jgi:phospholipid-transporting ATPase
VIFAPLAFVIGLGILKELLAEIKRYKADKMTNAMLYDVICPIGHTEYAINNKFKQIRTQKIPFQEIKVGDMIRVHDSQSFPADCILLKMENEKNESFTKTVALDGERNLKPKVACRALVNNFNKVFDPSNPVTEPVLTVNSIKPIKDLYTYNGRITFKAEGDTHTENIDVNTFLHRDSFLENSKSVIALVIHTGTETKTMMNVGQYKFKMSRFEKVLNLILICNLILAFSLNILNMLLFMRWTRDVLEAKSARYVWFKLLKPGETVVPMPMMAFKNFMTVYLIVNQFVPLDLLVAIEISKLVYTGIMESDVSMMIEDYDIRDVSGFRANHLGLHEELSLVEYIFCDKTGTLTKNEMVFRALSLHDGQHFFYDQMNPVNMMQADLARPGVKGAYLDGVMNLFRCIGICHDCHAIKSQKGAGMSYNGPSVDEVALHDMAKEAGICYFTERDSSHFKLKLETNEEEYSVIKIFPFDSVRKCMSVLVQDPHNKSKAILFVKGADSSILSRTSNSSKVSNIQ